MKTVSIPPSSGRLNRIVSGSSRLTSSACFKVLRSVGEFQKAPSATISKLLVLLHGDFITEPNGLAARKTAVPTGGHFDAGDWGH